MHSTRLGALAEGARDDRPAILPVGSPEQPISLGVDWSSTENRVNDEASDLGGLDLGRERALESFDRHRPSGLRVADGMYSCGIPTSRLKF